MARVELINDGKAVIFECPGCPIDHAIPIVPNDQASWTFNGDLDKPTLNPSILARFPWKRNPDGTREEIVCHSFVRDGNIQFLDDCTHGLKGHTVPLYDIDDDDER